MRLVSIIAVSLLASSCAVGPNSPYAQAKDAAYIADLDKALAGKVAGKPQNCINLTQSYSTEQIGDKTILYKVNRKFLYRNDLRSSCPNLGRDYGLVTRIYGSQLCQGDLVQPTDFTTGFSGGVCSLGAFVPYQTN
ncbi:MAG: hypothetical protein ACKVOJ_06255 [Sphingomonadaceae bacterium]